MGSAQPARLPVQNRGRQTLQRILQTTSRMLKQRQFDDISITEILAEARVTAGSFYARFESKEDIMPALLEDYEAMRTQFFHRRLGSAKWDDMSLEETVYAMVKLLADFFRDHSGQIRAFVMYFRARPQLFSARQKKDLDSVHELATEKLLRFRHEFADADPVQVARDAISLTVSAIRDKILFESRPYNFQSIPHSRLIRQLSHMMYAFLMQPKSR